MIVQLSTLSTIFGDGDKVTRESLATHGAVGNRFNGRLIKIVGRRQIENRLLVQIDACTRSAVEAIRSAGGSVEINKR